MHKHETSSGYKEIIPYIYVGISKCCRPTFALVDGEKADINFEGHLNTDLLFKGANFITSLVKQKIKVYINYENENSKAIFFVAAYLILQGMSIDKSINLIKKKGFDIDIKDRKLLSEIKIQK